MDSKKIFPILIEDLIGQIQKNPKMKKHLIGKFLDDYFNHIPDLDRKELFETLILLALQPLQNALLNLDSNFRRRFQPRYPGALPF